MGRKRKTTKNRPVTASVSEERSRAEEPERGPGNSKRHAETVTVAKGTETKDTFAVSEEHIKAEPDRELGHADRHAEPATAASGTEPIGNRQNKWSDLGALGVEADDNSKSFDYTRNHDSAMTGLNQQFNISSINTQIGDGNVILGNTSSDSEWQSHDDRIGNEKNVNQNCATSGARRKTYAKATAPVSTEQLNITTNIIIPSGPQKHAITDKRKQKEISTFLEKTFDFEKGHYILVVGSVKQVRNLGVLGLVPWIAVLDFDPDSRLNGLCSYVENTLEKKRSPHINTWQDKCTITDQTTCWTFMRGSYDRPDSLLDIDFKEWKKKADKDLRSIIGQLETFKQGYTEYTVIVIWHEDKEVCRHLSYTLLKLEERLNPGFIVVNDGNDQSTLPNADFFGDIEIVELGIQDICEAMQGKLKLDDEPATANYMLPTSDTTNDLCIDEKDAQSLKEELEVLYIDNKTGVNYDMQQLKNEEVDFFRGGTLPWAWWYHVGAGDADAERDIKDAIIEYIKVHHINQCKSGRVTLYHSPGSGGTTLAQRVLWDLRKEIPCVQVQHRSDQSMTGLAEKIQFLSERTHLPILLLMDGEEEPKVEHIQRILNCCFIILYVKRCHEMPNNIGRSSFWLQPFVSKEESKRIGKKFLDQCSTDKQKRAVHGLIEDINTDMCHSIFEFGLAVHSYEYKGICSYVKGFLHLDDNKDRKLHEWQRALVMLSLAYYYGQTSVPCQLLSTLIKPRGSRKILFFNDFPPEMKELIVRDPHERRFNVVRISHYFVAKEILDQVLLWQQGLHDIPKRQMSPYISNKTKKYLEPNVIEFIEISGEVNRHSAGDTVLKVLIRTIISRDNTAVGEEETQAARYKKQSLSAILEDVSHSAPFTERFNVMEKLTEAFPKEPQFHAHLGRLYTICRPEEEIKAERCFRKALDICEDMTKGMEDDELPLNMKFTLMRIYHMYGNMFARRISKYTGRHMGDRPRISTDPSDVEYISQILFDNTLQSCKYFCKCREITPPGCEKSVGYIGEIQVRLMFCDFIKRNKYKSSKKNSIHSLYEEDKSEIGEFVGECFTKLDELFIDCFTSTEPDKMDQGMWICQHWYVNLFNTTHTPGHFMIRNVEGVDSSRKKIVMLKMKYSDSKTFGVIDLVTRQEDIVAIVTAYENIFSEVGKYMQQMSKRELDIHYREWLCAIRHAKCPKPYTIELVLTHVQTWFDSIKTQYARFYLFILKTLLGFGDAESSGNTMLLIEAQALKDDLIKYSKYMVKAKYPREWLGPSGQEIRRIIPGKRFFGHIENHESPTSISSADLKLEIMKGTICPPNDKPAVGYISLDLGYANRVPVKIFYVPARSDMIGEMNKGARVEFVIGFSMSHGYEAFNVQKLGRVICGTCKKLNEYKSKDQYVKCNRCNVTTVIHKKAERSASP